MSVLSLTEIRKRYGNTVALDKVSLQVSTGEFICLLGASGCGKTTLLRIIAGLEIHDHGDISLDDKDLSGVPCHKRNIGMVFQSLALFPHLNVEKNITYGLKMRGESADSMQVRAKDLLDMVGLNGYASRSITSLSGGQKQRVAIARALALEPQLFLMDEPFSALDASLRDHLQKELRQLQKSLGITTIFVTHDQSEAMALADRIVILNDGKVEQAGTPNEIYQQPATPFVAEFIGSNNLLNIDVSANGIRCCGYNLGLPHGSIRHLRGEHTLAIRPEAIQLHTSRTGETLLQGTVAMQRPVGALVEHEIDVGGLSIKQTSFQNVGSKLVVGDNVYLQWDWQQVWCLPGGQHD